MSSDTTARNARHANPVDLCAQSDLLGAPEPMKIEAVLGAQIGGSACGGLAERLLRSVGVLPGYDAAAGRAGLGVGAVAGVRERHQAAGGGR